MHWLVDWKADFGRCEVEEKAGRQDGVGRSREGKRWHIKAI